MRMHKNNTAAFKAQRLRVLRRDANTCYYCGADDATHVDHVIAKAKGGGDELDNLVTACAQCNQLKGVKSQGAFLASRSAPPVFSGCLSPGTVITVQPGTCYGQPEQDLKQ
jgi:5-methylcytosine-specific restriction endonuclease McrA